MMMMLTLGVKRLNYKCESTTKVFQMGHDKTMIQIYNRMGVKKKKNEGVALTSQYQPD